MFWTRALKSRLKTCYDIRGLGLAAQDALLLGQSFGSFLIQNGKKKIVIGYDRRKDSSKLSKFFIEGAISTGLNVISIGESTTGCVQVAEFCLAVDASIMVTASHNFSNYHGFKFTYGGNNFYGEQLSLLVQNILDRNFTKGRGKLKVCKFFPKYRVLLEEKLQEMIIPKEKKIEKHIICWDLMNSPAATIFPYIASLLSGKNYVLNYKRDYEFSGFAPDPTYEPRLDDIKNLISKTNADFGIAFDGDCDRCVILTNKGRVIAGDKLLYLFGFLHHRITSQKLKIIWDTKSSQRLIEASKSFSIPIVSSIGTPNMRNSLISNDADMCGECSGHYMFKEFYNLSDGIYVALKFINYMRVIKKNNPEETLEDMLSQLPDVYPLQMRDILCKDEFKEEAMEKIESLITKKLLTYEKGDGIKVFSTCGWWRIRISNTEPKLRIGGESITQEGLEMMQEEILSLISYIPFLWSDSGK